MQERVAGHEKRIDCFRFKFIFGAVFASSVVRTDRQFDGIP